jgi:hypothetical protein
MMVSMRVHVQMMTARPPDRECQAALIKAQAAKQWQTQARLSTADRFHFLRSPGRPFKAQAALALVQGLLASLNI